MWYTLLGVAQYTVWEAAYLHCCATGRIPYLRCDTLTILSWDTITISRYHHSDEMAASSAYNLALFVAAAFWVPLYREFHFYFAHR